MPKPVVTCDICGQKIRIDDEFYSMPDGDILCTEDACLKEWANWYLEGG